MRSKLGKIGKSLTLLTSTWTFRFFTPKMAPNPLLAREILKKLKIAKT